MTVSKASSFFREVPIDSPVHRLRAETKILAGVFVSVGLVFNPQWSHVGVAAALVIGVFIAARLPRSVIPRVPVLLVYGIFGGVMGAAASGGEPELAGIGLGGLLDFLRLLVVGFVMVLWAGILSWTTGLTAVGFGIRRLLKPLRRIGVPVDEIGTVVALAVRSLPLVADEVQIVNESMNTRPAPADHQGKPFREAFAFIGDTSTAIVIGAHRRARDMAMALVSRGSTSAPEPPQAGFSRNDRLVLIGAAALCLAAFLIPGVPAPDTPGS